MDNDIKKQNGQKDNDRPSQQGLRRRALIASLVGKIQRSLEKDKPQKLQNRGVYLKQLIAASEKKDPRFKQSPEYRVATEVLSKLGRSGIDLTKLKKKKKGSSSPWLIYTAFETNRRKH